MSVVDEIRGDEDPLWDSGRVDICCEIVEVALEFCTGGNVGDGIEDDGWVVFADIVYIRWARSVEIVCLGETIYIIIVV
jgi:hypothetical protein